jgi:hypothetical protein
VNPDIKMAAGDPIITVAGGASLTLNGVLSDLNAGQPAGLTINGPGTLTLNPSSTAEVGNALFLGAGGQKSSLHFHYDFIWRGSCIPICCRRIA